MNELLDKIENALIASIKKEFFDAYELNENGDGSLFIKIDDAVIPLLVKMEIEELNTRIDAYKQTGKNDFLVEYGFTIDFSLKVSRTKQLMDAYKKSAEEILGRDFVIRNLKTKSGKMITMQETLATLNNTYPLNMFYFETYPSVFLLKSCVDNIKGMKKYITIS